MQVFSMAAEAVCVWEQILIHFMDIFRHNPMDNCSRSVSTSCWDRSYNICRYAAIKYIQLDWIIAVETEHNLAMGVYFPLFLCKLLQG